MINGVKPSKQVRVSLENIIDATFYCPHDPDGCGNTGLKSITGPPMKTPFPDLFGSGSGSNISVIEVNNSNITQINSFLLEQNTQFYINILNAIDNMMLLDYIRDNVVPEETDPVQYNVTQTLDIDLDLALAYYTIKYPEDTYVDPIKLEGIKILISNELQ